MSGLELIIEDGDLATWMPINNAFALEPESEPPHPRWYRSGLVIPIGTYRQHLKGAPPLDVLGAVRFERADGSPVKTLMGNLEWVNIVADDKEAGPLYPHSTQADCLALENHLPDLKRRVQAITQGWLEPLALTITCWQGPHGYDISVTEGFGSKGRRNTRYEFKLKDDALVRIKHKHPKNRKTEDLTEQLEEVTRIVISSIRTGAGPDVGGVDAKPTKP